MAKNDGVASILRKASQDVRLSYTNAAPQPEDGSQAQPGIFSVLDYIEQPWGLAMRLYPAQKFLVKLYYSLPLDDKLAADPHDRIRITDMFNTKTLYEFSETEYLSYLFNEGRCNIGVQDHDRRELILSIGRRSGKCVEWDTLTPTDQGIFRIGELGQAPEDGFTDLQVGVAQEAGKQARSAAFYDGGVKETFQVRTQDGYYISGTGNHRIKVLSESGVVEWRFLDQLRVGDYVAVNRSTNLWAKDYVNLRPYHNTEGLKQIDLPVVLDESLGNFLGYLVGDGTWNDGHATAITVEHPETWDHLKERFKEILGEPRIQMDERTENTGRLEFCSVGVRRFFHDIGWEMGWDRYSKMVPWAILRSPKPVVCAFLRGLFETDGCVENGGSRITFSSASFRLAHEVQVLLLNLGIISSVRKKWNKKTRRHYAALAIKGVRSRKLFAEHVGFDSDKKRIPMLEALEGATEGKSDTESVPHQYQQARTMLESIPKLKPGQGWGRSKLREVLGNVIKPSCGEDITYARMLRAVGIGKELGVDTSHFEELLRLDYFYSAVTSVEQAEAHVFDLTVPDGESFVANGFTNHNTTLAGIFASYEVYRLLNLYNPQQFYGLPNGNRIQIISVATDKDQAGLLFNEVTSHLVKCSYFNQYIGNNTLSHVNFRTPYDIQKFGPTVRQDNGRFVSLNGKATLRVTFKSCIAKGLRGSGNIVVILDEVAHFQDKGQSSAKDIYDAVTPSTAAFSPKNGKGIPQGEVESRIILISSPLGKFGKFYELFDLAMHGGPGSDNLLAIQAPTWEVNPTVPASYYKQKYHADPVVFMVEHGAQFSDQVTGWIERESDLLACVDPGLRPKEFATPRMPHQMGIDVGLCDDGTGICITHIEGDKIVLDYHEVWYAGVDWRESNPHLAEAYPTPYARTLSTVERLDFDEISEWIYALTKKFYITEGLFDRWNGIPLEQALHKKGLKQFKAEFFTRDQTSKIYQSAKMFIYDERLVLYDYPLEEGSTKHSPLISELLTLQAKQVGKNLILVEKPGKAGAKDDVSDALVRSIWLSTKQMEDQKHVSHGVGTYQPRVVSSMTPARYQTLRAMKHGGVQSRVVPGRGRIPGLRRY